MSFGESKKQKSEPLTQEEIVQLAVMQEELNALKKEQGIEKKPSGFARLVSAYLDSGEEKPKKVYTVNRRKYFCFLLFTGWCGGHQFYAGKYPAAWLYLLFFWTGFPFAMAIADFLVWLPKKADEQGNIEL